MTATLAALRAEAVSDWVACNDSFYSQEQLYTLAWQDVDLEQQRVAAAPFGGPIALMRDEGALVVVGSSGGAGGAGRPLVRLFSCSGVLAGSFLWEGGRLAAWGWSSELELVMVDTAGKVFFHGLSGCRCPKAVSFGRQLEAEGLAHALVYSDGLVVMGATSGQLWAVVGLAEPRATRLPPVPGLAARQAGSGSSGGGAGASCIALLEPRFTLSSGLEVLVAVGEVIWVVDDHGATDQPLPPGCGGVAALAVSPNGAFVAAACGDGKLRVLASDFSATLSEFDSRSGLPPRLLAWCGTDAVALAWEGLLLLAGAYGDWLRLPADAGTVLVPEVDGLRLLTSISVSLLRRVPDVLVQVYKPGSTSPAAQLLNARDLFDAGSARADRLLRGLAGQLDDAVEGCAAAAGLELCVPRQRALLRAAVFGRAFARRVDPGLLHGLAVRLRVLNALRQPDVGMPLTMPQLEALSMPVVVNRLVAARHYLLASRVAELLGPDARRAVLLHWGAAKISASPALADAALREAVAAKLTGLERPPFAALAAHAQSVGRRSLAMALLEEEPSAAQQVPLLLSLARTAAAGAASGDGQAHGGGEEPLGRALRKAVECGDPDLVYLALFAGYRATPLPAFWALVAPRASARALFAKYARAKEPELLETLYVTQGLAAEAAELDLDAAAAALAPPGSTGSSSSGSSAVSHHRPDDAAVVKAAARLTDAAAKFGQGREHAWQCRSASEAAALLKEQSRLERETGQALFVGLSLADTIATCLRLGHTKAAASLRKAFSVPEPRWAWIKLRVAAEAADWPALELLGAERRPAIPLEALAEAAATAGAPRDVQARLIARLPDTRAKAAAFEAAGCPREAAEVAAKLRDGDLLARIAGAVSANSPAGLAIGQIRDTFQASFRS